MRKLLSLLLGALAVLGLNWLIRRSLAAPRVPETGEPEGLPWQAVRIATLRGRRLFGWFIPAGEGAPALAIVHGWGGNAELMLPLAAPLHRAGYALLFFDARDTRQVRRALELMAHYQGRLKPILTGGSYLDLMKSWRIPVYYDQQGLLTRRLGITQVPALVSQDGKRLRIDEMEVTR